MSDQDKTISELSTTIMRLVAMQSSIQPVQAYPAIEFRNLNDDTYSTVVGSLNSEFQLLSVRQLKEKLYKAESQLKKCHQLFTEREPISDASMVCHNGNSMTLGQLKQRLSKTELLLDKQTETLKQQQQINSDWRVPQVGDKVRLIRLPKNAAVDKKHVGNIFSAVEINQIEKEVSLRVIVKDGCDCVINLPLDCFEPVS